MKKRVLSLLLALVMTLAFAPTALAAPMEDNEMVLEWLNDTVINSTIVTPHEYLGDVQFGNLWLFGEPCDWEFPVLIVDDAVTSLDLNVYVSQKNGDFVAPEISGGLSYYDGQVNTVFQTIDAIDAAITQEDPVVLSFDLASGWFANPSQFIPMYSDADQWEEIGWVAYSAIVFTESQLAEFKATGNLPPTSPDEDLTPYLDLTELKALLSGEVAAEPETVEETEAVAEEPEAVEADVVEAEIVEDAAAEEIIPVQEAIAEPAPAPVAEPVVISAPVVYGAGTAVVDNCYFVNIRKGPGVSNTAFAYIAKGEVVTIIEKKDNNWYHIQTSTVDGWVYGAYLDVQ